METVIYNLKELEIETIKNAFKNFPDDSKQFIADLLGIKYKSLLYKMRIHNIVPSKFDVPEVDVKALKEELTEKGYRF